MSTDKTYFLLFRSIHDVLKAEKMLKKSKAVFELVPVPRQISSECGICIRSTRSPEDLLLVTGTPMVERCYTFDGTEYILRESEAEGGRQGYDEVCYDPD